MHVYPILKYHRVQNNEIKESGQPFTMKLKVSIVDWQNLLLCMEEMCIEIELKSLSLDFFFFLIIKCCDL